MSNLNLNKFKTQNISQSDYYGVGQLKGKTNKLSADDLKSLQKIISNLYEIEKDKLPAKAKKATDPANYSKVGDWLEAIKANFGDFSVNADGKFSINCNSKSYQFDSNGQYFINGANSSNKFTAFIPDKNSPLSQIAGLTGRGISRERLDIQDLQAFQELARGLNLLGKHEQLISSDGKTWNTAKVEELISQLRFVGKVDGYLAAIKQDGTQTVCSFSLSSGWSVNNTKVLVEDKVGNLKIISQADYRNSFSSHKYQQGISESSATIAKDSKVDIKQEQDKAEIISGFTKVGTDYKFDELDAKVLANVLEDLSKKLGKDINLKDLQVYHFINNRQLVVRLNDNSQYQFQVSLDGQIKDVKNTQIDKDITDLNLSKIVPQESQKVEGSPQKPDNTLTQEQYIRQSVLRNDKNFINVDILRSSSFTTQINDLTAERDNGKVNNMLITLRSNHDRDYKIFIGNLANILGDQDPKNDEQAINLIKRLADPNILADILKEANDQGKVTLFTNLDPAQKTQLLKKLNEDETKNLATALKAQNKDLGTELVPYIRDSKQLLTVFDTLESNSDKISFIDNIQGQDLAVDFVASYIDTNQSDNKGLLLVAQLDEQNINQIYLSKIIYLMSQTQIGQQALANSLIAISNENPKITALDKAIIDNDTAVKAFFDNLPTGPRNAEIISEIATIRGEDQFILQTALPKLLKLIKDDPSTKDENELATALLKLYHAFQEITPDDNNSAAFMEELEKLGANKLLNSFVEKLGSEDIKVILNSYKERPAYIPDEFFNRLSLEQLESVVDNLTTPQLAKALDKFLLSKGQNTPKMEDEFFKRLPNISPKDKDNQYIQKFLVDYLQSKTVNNEKSRLILEKMTPQAAIKFYRASNSKTKEAFLKAYQEIHKEIENLDGVADLSIKDLKIAAKYNVDSLEKTGNGLTIGNNSYAVMKNTDGRPVLTINGKYEFSKSAITNAYNNFFFAIGETETALVGKNSENQKALHDIVRLVTMGRRFEDLDPAKGEPQAIIALAMALLNQDGQFSFAQRQEIILSSLKTLGWVGKESGENVAAKVLFFSNVETLVGVSQDGNKKPEMINFIENNGENLTLINFAKALKANPVDQTFITSEQFMRLDKDFLEAQFKELSLSEISKNPKINSIKFITADQQHFSFIDGKVYDDKGQEYPKDNWQNLRIIFYEISEIDNNSQNSSNDEILSKEEWERLKKYFKENPKGTAETSISDEEIKKILQKLYGQGYTYDDVIEAIKDELEEEAAKQENDKQNTSAPNNLTSGQESSPQNQSNLTNFGINQVSLLGLPPNETPGGLSFGVYYAPDDQK